MSTTYAVSQIVEPDYLKLLVTLDAGNRILFENRLREWEQNALESFGIEVKHTRTFLKSGLLNGDMYSYEWAGQNAYVVYAIPASQVAQWVTRLDVKKKYNMSAQTFEQVQELVTNGNVGRRNFSTARSRVRTKTDKRDAGGVSFSVGSHKSEYRINFSMRGSEGGYLEYQYRGKKLREQWERSREFVTQSSMTGLFWSHLLESMFMAGQQDLAGIIGINAPYVDKILQGALSDDYDKLQADMETLEARVKQLPRTAALNLMASIVAHFGVKVEEFMSMPPM